MRYPLLSPSPPLLISALRQSRQCCRRVGKNFSVHQHRAAVNIFIYTSGTTSAEQRSVVHQIEWSPVQTLILQQNRATLNTTGHHITVKLCS